MRSGRTTNTRGKNNGNTATNQNPFPISKRLSNEYSNYGTDAGGLIHRINLTRYVIHGKQRFNDAICKYSNMFLMPHKR